MDFGAAEMQKIGRKANGLKTLRALERLESVRNVMTPDPTIEVAKEMRDE